MIGIVQRETNKTQSATLASHMPIGNPFGPLCTGVLVHHMGTDINSKKLRQNVGI